MLKTNKEKKGRLAPSRNKNKNSQRIKKKAAYNFKPPFSVFIYRAVIILYGNPQACEHENERLLHSDYRCDLRP